MAKYKDDRMNKVEYAVIQESYNIASGTSWTMETKTDRYIKLRSKNEVDALNEVAGMGWKIVCSSNSGVTEFSGKSAFVIKRKVSEADVNGK